MINQETYQSLVHGLRSKEKGIISRLYDHYADALYGIILRIVKNESVAQEILQLTFVKIWQNSEKYDPSKGRLLLG